MINHLSEFNQCRVELPSRESPENTCDAIPRHRNGAAKIHGKK